MSATNGGMTDALLMGHIAAGEWEYVRPLIERHEAALIAFLRRITGRPADADDIFQEVWLRVVKSARSYDPAQRFSAWLFTIAWNRVRDYWRRRADVDARRVDHERSREWLNVPAETPPADEEILEAERGRRLREIVASLPDPLAEVVGLRYFEDLSEKEMAARLGVPLGTVKSRLHHGIRRLASMLGEERS
jgi:RNA polymerase sigma-70 factor, ECF subfamily